MIFSVELNLAEFGVTRSVVNLRLVMVKLSKSCFIVSSGICVVVGFTAVREQTLHRENKNRIFIRHSVLNIFLYV